MKLTIVFLFIVITDTFAQTIAVKVRVSDGIMCTPVIGASVISSQGNPVTVWTDEEGVSVITILPIVPETLQVRSSAYHDYWRRVSVSADTVWEIYLRPSRQGTAIVFGDGGGDCSEWFPVAEKGKARVVGKILDKVTGFPLADATISVGFWRYLDEKGTIHEGGACSLIADSTGMYALRNIWPGTYFLTAGTQGKSYGLTTQQICVKADSTYILNFELVENPAKK